MLGNLKIIASTNDARQTAPARNAAEDVVQACFHVYHALGGGMRADIYRQCLAEELKQAGASFQRDVAIPLSYRDLQLDQALMADFVMGETVLLLVRTGGDPKAHELELRSALRLAGKEEGYLVDFQVSDIRKGILHAKVKLPLPPAGTTVN